MLLDNMTEQDNTINALYAELSQLNHDLTEAKEWYSQCEQRISSLTAESESKQAMIDELTSEKERLSFMLEVIPEKIRKKYLKNIE